MYQSSREETNIGIEHSHGGHILIEYQRTKCFKFDSMPRSILKSFSMVQKVYIYPRPFAVWRMRPCMLMDFSLKDNPEISCIFRPNFSRKPLILTLLIKYFQNNNINLYNPFELHKLYAFMYFFMCMNLYCVENIFWHI